LSDIDDLIDSIQRQLQANGLDEIAGDLELCSRELDNINEYLTSAFLQDFSYDNVQPVANMLRGSKYMIDEARRSFGGASAAITQAAYKIRSA
jgi:hypothetical protein